MNTAVFIDGGHFFEIRKSFALANPRFKVVDPQTGEASLAGIHMGSFLDFCLSRCRPGAEAVMQRYYDGKPSTDPSMNNKVWTAEEKVKMRVDMEQLRKRSAFHHEIKEQRYGQYVVKLGRMVWRSTTCCDRRYAMQKEVDTRLTVDIIDLVWRHPEIEQLVLVTSDSDLIPPIRYAQCPNGEGKYDLRDYREGLRAKKIVLLHGPEPEPGRYKALIDAADHAHEIRPADLLECLK